ncbi:hypothetical protein F5884DRAFT_858903 [Xylogone sp. PMI_703]|nr:hypothetical protein F5884DRAFT_858903 [Xylogone sp. PMI_703]
MFISKSLPFALITTSVAAFTFPADLKNGNYRVSINETGYEVHEIGTGSDNWDVVSAFLSTSKPIEENPLTSRDDCSGMADAQGGCYAIWCGCGFTLDHGQCDAATAALRAQTGDNVKIPWGQAYYSISGNTVVGACNYPTPVNTGFPAEGANFPTYYLDESLGYIDKHCGRYVAGTAFFYEVFDPQTLWPQILHQRYAAGDDFCVTDQLSSVENC